MKKYEIGLFFVAVAWGSCGASQEQPLTDWQVARESGSIELFRMAAPHLEDSELPSPRLLLRCVKGKFEMAVEIGVATHGNRVLRFDGKRLHTEIMRDSEDGKTVFFESPWSIVPKLRDHSKMLFRYTPLDGNPTAVNFDLQGLEALIPALEAECNLGPGSEEFEEPLFAGVGGVSNPVVVKKIPPKYPRKAQKSRLEGSVILKAVINADGTVGEVIVIQSNKPAKWGFGVAAIKAVKKWRYEPALRNGEPVSVYFTIFIDYKLH